MGRVKEGVLTATRKASKSARTQNLRSTCLLVIWRANAVQLTVLDVLFGKCAVSPQWRRHWNPAAASPQWLRHWNPAAASPQWQRHWSPATGDVSIRRSLNMYHFPLRWAVCMKSVLLFRCNATCRLHWTRSNRN